MDLIAYGIEAAAQTFFNKSAKDLTLSEAAILAALPNAPTYYSPYGNNQDKYLIVKNFILEKMLKTWFNQSRTI
jgi:penicillin-binding protein 1A